MNNLKRLAVIIAVLGLTGGQLRAQCGSGCGVAGGILRPTGFAPSISGHLAQLHGMAGRVAGGPMLHPMNTVGEGYHPSAMAHPAIFGHDIASPYGGFPGMDCGGYFNGGDVCCGPSWYDVSIQGVFLRRSGDVSTPISRHDPNFFDAANLPDGTEPIVLSTDSANLDLTGTYRVAVQFQLDAVSSIEAVYMGELESDGSASFTTTNNGIFHVFSQFGTNPVGGYPDTDQANFTAIEEFETQLESLELLMRKAWITPGGRLHGSWTFGGRYLRVEDKFRHFTRTDSHVNPFVADPTADPPVLPLIEGDMRYHIDTTNDLVGIQLGPQFGACIIPGLTVNGYAKLGLYGNHAGVRSQIRVANVEGAPEIVNPLVEDDSTTRFTYGSDLGAYALWQFHPLMKLRLGYEVLYINEVATAPANFDVGTPFPPAPQRNVDVRRDDLLYHGFNVGFELGW